MARSARGAPNPLRTPRAVHSRAEAQGTHSGNQGQAQASGSPSCRKQQRPRPHQKEAICCPELFEVCSPQPPTGKTIWLRRLIG